MRRSPGTVVLGVDSALDRISAAVFKDGQILGSFSEKRAGEHLVYLMPRIMDLLISCDLSFVNLSGIGVTSGPGSFTGLRLALATVRTLAQILGIRVVPLNTLDVIAQNAKDTQALICPLIDARRGEIFASFYRFTENSSQMRISPYLTFTPQDLVEELKRCEEPIVLLGDAIRKYGKNLEEAELKMIEILPEEYWYPVPQTIASLSAAVLAEGGGLFWENLEAFYMRPSQAEEQRMRR